MKVGGNGWLGLNGCSIVVGSLSDGTSGTGGVIADSSGDLSWLTVATTAPATAPDVFTGDIQDRIRLMKSDTGVLVLAGTDSYTAGTEVDDGTLKLGSLAHFRAVPRRKGPTAGSRSTPPARST